MGKLSGIVRLGVRLLVFLVVTVGVAAAGAWLFVVFPGNLTDLFGVLFAVLVGVAGLQIAARMASSAAPSHNVGEVTVEGPITRSGTPGGVPGGPSGHGADDLVEEIENADDDGNVEALIVKLNTPGGQVVPSEDIRLAAERFDGPTIAYATDTCASGGYWIASGCDEFWAREGSVVGSIGVIGSRVNATELADRAGLSYERLVAGDYKDAGMPLKEMTEDDREYLQGIIDDYYESFVDRVTEGRDLEPETVRDTEARIYLGEEAHEMGLVDRLGTREEIEDVLADGLGVDEVTVKEFEPSKALSERLRGGAQSVAYALGAGIASTFADDGREFDFRL